MRTPLTLDVASGLEEGTPLVVIDSTHSFSVGDIVLLDRVDENDNMVTVKRLDGRVIGDGGWFPYRFALYHLDRPMVASEIPEAASAIIQQAAFDAGWEWVCTRTEILRHDQFRGGISFHPNGDMGDRPKVMYSDPDLGGAGNLDLKWDTHETAIRWLLTHVGDAQADDTNEVMTIEDILPADLLVLVRTNPGNPQLRGLIRAATNLPVPTATIAEGPEAIIKWLMENAKKPTEDLPEPEPVPVPTAPAATPTGTVEVTFEIEERVSGHTYWTRTDTVEGRAFVPREVFDQGEEAVENWIKEHYRGGRRCAVIDDTQCGDESCGDSDTDDTEFECMNETNFDEVQDELEEAQ